MLPRTSSIWQRDSHPTASGKPGAVQYRVIKTGGARSWVLLHQQNGKRREYGLGSAKTIGLAEARQRAAETRKQVQAGVDPVEAKRASRRILAAMPTFREAALAVHLERERY